MAALAEVLPHDFILLRSQKIIEILADKLQREKIGSSAVGED